MCLMLAQCLLIASVFSLATSCCWKRVCMCVYWEKPAFGGTALWNVLLLWVPEASAHGWPLTPAGET